MVYKKRRNFIASAFRSLVAASLSYAFPIQALWAASEIHSVTLGKPSGADDTDLIQAAIDSIKSTGGKLLIPAGEYIIDAMRGVKLRDNVQMRLLPGAIMRAKPNSSGAYSILKIYDVKNVTITGGEFIGDRAQHLGTSGEWGMGIDIRGSTNVLVANTNVSSCWGDGIYIGQDPKSLRGCGTITLRQVTSDGNRRQGLSITACSGAVIEQCAFINTHGTAPACGIDLESNTGTTVENIKIVACVATDNHGDGIQLTGGVKHGRGGERTGVVRDIDISRCVIKSNGRYGVYVGGVQNSDIAENEICGSQGYGIYIRSITDGLTILRNDIRNNRKGGSSASDIIGGLIRPAVENVGSDHVFIERGASHIILE